jgi:penicillin-binding protein 2
MRYEKIKMEKETFFNNLIKILFAVLIARCFYLQVIQHSYYSRLSQSNCIRTIETGTPRGVIYDRNGRVLAKDIPCLNLVFIPYDLENPEKEAEILSGIISYEKNTILRKFTRNYYNPYDRITLKRKLDEGEIAIIEEKIGSLPGVFLQEGVTREYPLGQAASHLIGYVGELSRSQLETAGEKGYKMGDVLGQTGIEKYYDKFLRGLPGGIQVEIDALGHHGRILGKKESTAGNNLMLTIDSTIQEIAYQELGNREGCVVIADPKSGQILALVSRPGFAPENPQEYFNKSGNPFLNRVINGQYPPGSIFKIITEIAALETDTIEEYDRVECTGEVEIGNRLFHCWKEEGHGWVDINVALPFSCNIFFGVIGTKVGVTDILKVAKEFNIGKCTGIDLPEEKCGYLPGRYEIDPLNLSIGQGNLLTTPLQLLSLISTVANGGNVWRPFLLKEIKTEKNEMVKENYPKIEKTVYISSETIDVLQRGLRNVVVFGTGRYAEVEGLEVAGKTGTAQRAHRELEATTRGAFVCFAPFHSPRVSMVVYLDHASSAEAAIIAGRILRKIFMGGGNIIEENEKNEQI